MTAPKTSSEIRSAFLHYFQEHGHEVVASGSLIPPNDPTLMFANAGMVQFKDVFTGRDKRAYKRATSSQKCIRISGKHNDLENVGRTARHHTFFEMLGNFSFGDYFKADAIAFAWELLTRDLGMDPSKLAITVFGGADGIAADDEAREIWKKVTGFGDDRILGLGMKDNFWQMGDTGPCGPCSEIHSFVGGEPDLSLFGQDPDESGRGWVEIWNLVFMQFERSIVDGQAKLDPLPAPCVDTGAGLERITAVMQGVLSNYDTDLFRPMIERAAEIAGKKYTASTADDDTSMRVIADHARTTAFMIAEGVMPDRDGRPYVLRRVMRRAIRHGHRLGIRRPFLHEVALEVVALMSDTYPELRERKDMIASVAEQEEVRFRETIDRGLKILEEEFGAMKGKDQKILAGDVAFKLYDTYGFPLDLTQVICDERMIGVDMEGYDKALAEAKARSEGSKLHDDAAVMPAYREALAKVEGAKVKFVGYDRESVDATVVAIIREGALEERADAGQQVEIVLDVTPFYGEAGGQMGDCGVLKSEAAVAAVSDAQKPVDGLTVHKAQIDSGTLCVGDKVVATVDHASREATRRNHSATHLLHYALRKVLGAHAQQKGSLVGADRLRFDFTHGKPLEDAELARIEDLVNDKVLVNAPVETRVMPIEEARKSGATAIFEEKYGDVVRVLTMTSDSVELCGGTHARATGDIGLFKIVSEQGIAAGVRRIEAVTGLNALGYVRGLEDTVQRAAKVAKTGGADLIDKLEKIVSRERELEKQIAELTRKLAMGGGGGVDALLGKAREVKGVKVLSIRAEVADPAALREMAEKLRDKLGDAVVVVGAAAGEKASLVATVSKALTQRIKAGDLVRPIAKLVGGSGGGRPDMAQAGGSDPSKLDEALEQVYELVAQMLV
ncbi:MAG: alanine--tRNA ligase [Deltaproteobacteria bacterium]|nr:alanine--tRNA ligase [Deltaproteobacteria bacterium]